VSSATEKWVKRAKRCRRIIASEGNFVAVEYLKRFRKPEKIKINVK